MTNILGISAFYHDSAASMIVNGDITAAAQEERFTRIKHDSNFPTNAIKYCLNENNLSLKETILTIIPPGNKRIARIVTKPNDIDLQTPKFSKKHWKILLNLVKLTYVPASHKSRVEGAGGGNDND